MSHHSSIIKAVLNSPLSISDLQPIAQVSLPTLRKAIQELTDTRWIRVVGQSEANGGRPPMLFGPDDSVYLMVGVHLQLPGMRLVASDLVGNVLDVEEDFTNEVPAPDAVIQRVLTYVTGVRARFPGRHMLGVGMASPGFTDPATGEILSIGRVAGWQNFPICQRLRTSLDLPVYIANDVDCMAFAEFQHTGTSLDKNLAYVGFDEAVKVSLFLNGQLYKGSFGNAGLIVTDLLKSNPSLSAEEQHHILTIDGLNRLFDAKMSALSAGDRAAYAPIIATQNHRQRFQMILAGAAGGLPICREIGGYLNEALATAITNIIYVIQPDQVVIGGLLGAMAPSLYAELEADIRNQLSPLFTNRLLIQQATLLSPNCAGLGATYHFLQTYLSDTSMNVLHV